MTLARHGIRTLVAFLAAGLGGGAVAADFIYEGTLDEHGRPADGRYDLRLTLATSASDPLPLSTIDFPATEVVNGRFRLAFDLPGLAVAEPWVGLAVRAAGDSAFTTIPGRSKAIAGAGQCWGLTGDAGTDASINFLGTTDAQPLVLRARNTEALRIEPSSTLFDGSAATANIVAGSRANRALNFVRGATISGGGLPTGDSDPTVDAEAPNVVSDNFGTVGGGVGNVAGDNAGSVVDRPFATVGGGVNNVAGGMASTVAGGTGNLARGMRAAVGGGSFNWALRDDATVSGGTGNTATGFRSTVSGGSLNCAGGNDSWAGGRRAKVRPSSNVAPFVGACADVPDASFSGDNATFVWADGQDADFVSGGSNQFVVRAGGGVGINSTAIPAGIELLLANRGLPNLNVDLFMRSSANTRGINLAMLPGAGSNPAEFRIAQSDGSAFTDRMFLRANGDFEVTANAFKPGGGAWAASSDARLKHHVAPLSGTLDRLLSLQGVSYEYLAPDPAKRPAGIQVGFVAQDVQQVFPDWVSTDGDGYLMVAPRGFEALTVEALRELRAESASIDASQEDRLAALETRNAALEARNAELAAALDTLRAEVAALRSRGGQAP